MVTFLQLVFAGLIFVFLYLDGHVIVQQTVLRKYRRWRRLNTLVATTQRGTFMIIWASFKLVCRMFYLSFLQYMNSNIRLVPGKANQYEITYMIKGRMYRMLVTPLRGPAPILQVSNSSHEDITSQVLPYFGPRYDCHKTKILTSFFDIEGLTFELSTGDTVTCEPSQPIEDCLV